MSLQINPSGAAYQASVQLTQQANGFFAQMSGALYNGLPARGAIPAVAATDLQNALGPDNLAALLGAISGFAGPAS